MPNPSFRDYLRSLKAITALVATLGAFVPFLLDYKFLTPPFLLPVPWLVPALALISVLGVYHYRFREDKSRLRMPRLVRFGIRSLSISLGTLVLYLIILPLTTSVDPLEQRRYQIGFWKFGWSLTDFARKYKDPTETIRRWMLEGGYYHPDGPGQLWTMTSIIGAGLLLTVLFVLAFVLWCIGWCLIAKQHALDGMAPPRK